MKNNLLLTAAIALVMSVSANADADTGKVKATEKEPGGTSPTLKITGNALGTMHWFRNGKEARTGDINGEKGHGTLFALEDSRLNFQATGRMDSGWTDLSFYDWFIGITGDTNEEKVIEENRISVRTRLGMLRIGNAQGVESIMAKGAFSIPGGTGGFDGNFKTTTTRTAGLLLTTDMVGATKYGTKLTYITPRFHGFQGGISFTPNNEHKGEGTNGEPHNRTSNKNPKEPFDLSNIALGLNYVGKVTNDLSLGASITTVYGKTRPG